MKLIEITGIEVQRGDRVMDQTRVFHFVYDLQSLTDQYGTDHGAIAAKLDSRSALVLQERSLYKVLREV